MRRFIRSHIRVFILSALLGMTLVAGAERAPEAEFVRVAGGTAEQLAPEQLALRDALILGVVEGVTEYLPVSSTGHLILAAWVLDLDQESPGIKAFQIVIQLGAILAVLTLYKRPVARMLKGGIGRDRPGLIFGLKLFTAFLPAAIVGLLCEDLIDHYLFSQWWVAFFLAVGGLAMIVVEGMVKRRPRPPVSAGMSLVDGGLTWAQAVGIGCFQCLALCPGMSRSMVTIIGGLMLGLGMSRAAEFSFLLALPTLGAATVYKLLSAWGALIEGVGWMGISAGLLVSYVVAVISVKLLVSWLTKWGLSPFGVYRLIAAALVGLVLVAQRG
ncbi:MAG: undecaprenyl-diphosphate phosphatase [Lentisphaeria bacterium]|nr:undecaprenyl-diphosphate phosphatase [Lentisphaeria bacterium]